jgi:hypothetical protein
MHRRDLVRTALTYANNIQTDGAGAQLHRVYGIYALSRFLNLPYVHSPLKRIDYQGFSAFEHNNVCPDFESRWNNTFQIPSDVELPEDLMIHEMLTPDLKAIYRIGMSSQTVGAFAVIRILYPHQITDTIPDIYQHVKAISPFRRVRAEPFRLAIHVRRGELFVVESGRMLPNSYYVSCALKLIEFLNRFDIEFRCELHTEVASASFVVTPQHRGIGDRLTTNVTLGPELNRLEDFEAIPNLIRFINGDPIETLGRMATADALILSRSSFSYLAAILNTSCIVLYHPFWHRPMSDWLTVNSDGQVSTRDLETRLESWKRSNTEMRRGL